LKSDRNASCVDFWRSYLDCAVQTRPVYSPHHPLWPSSTSSSSNRIHCVPSFGVWRWGKTTNGLWRQPVVFFFFILLFVFFLSVYVCTSSPFLRPTTFG
jgi:hypothetical protein